MQPQSQTVDNPIQRFLNGTRFAVAGASKDRSKYGNKVLRALLDAGKDVVAVHPVETNVEGVPAHPMVSQVPYPIEAYRSLHRRPSPSALSPMQSKRA